MEYKVVGEELIIRDNAQQSVWQGKPEGYALQWASAVPGSDEGLALYYYYRPDKRSGAFRNLVRIKPDGSIVWHADLPAPDDTYTNAQLENGKLTAWSWGGYTAQINIETGRIIEQLFTK
jgi:hypothetical protein